MTIQQRLVDVAVRISQAAEMIEAAAVELRQIAEAIVAEPDTDEDQDTAHPWIDYRAQMPVATAPYDPMAWWVRSLDQIDGITLHHTLSQDPIAIAKYLISKGRPTTEYAFWIRENGEILYCADLTLGFWHDHTGHKNTHISVGLAGKRHVSPPPEAQMAATVRLVAYLMRTYGIEVSGVRGHNDYTQTTCPGWDAAKWRTTFYTRLEQERK